MLFGGDEDTLVNKTVCGVIVAGTSVGTISLNPNKVYSLSHDGEDPNGGVANQTIYFCTSGTVNTTFDAGFDKIKLKVGRPITIGPSFRNLYFATASGIACFSIIPGAPVN